MRLLHLVTLVAPDGAYGGPVRVAENQAAELLARGHHVTIAAAQIGYGSHPPSTLSGTPVRLFPLQRLVPGTPAFSGATSLRLHRWLWQAVRDVDLVHVHLARDLVSLPAAELVRRRRVPYVVQPHGMVVPSQHWLAGSLDGVVTRRVLRGAGAVLHLTGEERKGLTEVAGPRLALRHLRNGVPEAGEAPPPPTRPRVLFCARLQARKRPGLFVQMARQLLEEGLDAEFVLVGPDGGEARAVEEALHQHGDPQRLRWEGPVEPQAVLACLQSASVLVLPSVDEPYPMIVLEALSVGRPVVVTDTCGLAGAVRSHGCGFVVDDTLEDLVVAVRRLLTEPGRLLTASGAASEAAKRHFGMSSVVDELENVYEDALAGRRAASND